MSGPPPTSWTWGYLAAIALPRGGFDVVAVYHDGQRGAHRVRRFRAARRQYASTYGVAALTEVVELEDARAASPAAVAIAVQCAAEQLCIACGVRCYDRRESQPPRRHDSGRCQRCEAAALTS